jgi:hypothetical protein
MKRFDLKSLWNMELRPIIFVYSAIGPERLSVSAHMPLRGTRDDENGAGPGYDEFDPGTGSRS